MGFDGDTSRIRKKPHPPWYRGADANLLSAVVALSEEMESHGQIGFHWWPQAARFRTGACGMTAHGVDPDPGYECLFAPNIMREGRQFMKVEIGKEWSMRMAQLEGDAEIGAGRLAVDPVFDGETFPIAASQEEGPNVAFGRFVRLMRRQRGLTLEKLANDADVDIADLVEIEGDPHHRPEPRTAYQLANYFKVPRSGLMQMAGLTAPKDARLLDEAVRFAARSEPTAALTSEESAALEAFVAVLSEQS